MALKQQHKTDERVTNEMKMGETATVKQGKLQIQRSKLRPFCMPLQVKQYMYWRLNLE